MRATKPVILCAIMLLSCMPFANVQAASEEICCDSGPVELHLLGPAGSGSLSPFDSALAEESEEVLISDAIAQQREIATWKIDPAWGGSYPSSTWDFSIQYEVANAGGASINASVTVEIGGDSYTGTTDQSNSFLPAGSGNLQIGVNVDSGTIPSSTKISVTLSASTIVFSVPGGDAGLKFTWGGVDDESTITADIPLVDLLIDQPTTEGMEVYLSMVVASPFGQSTSAHANSLGSRVNGGELTSDPIETGSGENVRLTWTWVSAVEGAQTISVEGFIQIQSGTPTLSGTVEINVTTYDTGQGSGGGFYPSEEPLRTDGGGSPLIANMQMSLDYTDGYLTLDRTISLTLDEEIAYWMRWGMDNIGNDEPGLSQPLKIFKSGLVSDEERRNKIIDGVEINEFENQMVNLAVTYMNEGMALELEELIGNDVQSLERISFSIDLQGERRVTPHPLTMKISTLEVLDQNRVTTILRNFVIVQPSPIWSSVDINIDIDTAMMASLTGAEISGEDSIDLTHRRTPIGESISISVVNLKPSATFTFSAMPTANPLNAPLTLSIATLVLITAGFWLSMKITSNKRRSALWLELILIPVVLLALYLAYPPFTVGVISGVASVMWIITAVASPKKKTSKSSKSVANYPVIECPACGTPNTIATDERPVRIPCEGCGRVLKIVE